MTDISADSPYFAAIDLGSNSFHMLIVRFDGQKLEIIDREKDMVQIARGLGEDGKLSEYSMSTALGCLMRFRERLRVIPEAHIRAVGTKTLRSAQNSGDFLKNAEKALGAPIQIISGYEEARLIYNGLFHSVAPDEKRRLIIDIGGASTELVVGQAQEPDILESLSLGCVTFSKRFKLISGAITEKNMRRAYFDACARIEEVYKPILNSGWDIAFGTSGTVKAIAQLTKDKDGGPFIKAESLEQLIQDTIEHKGVNDTNLPQLRRDVLPAGMAILQAVLEQFNIDKIHVADATLKEGLIYDTIGRFSDHDARETTIQKMKRRYNVDEEQATRVSKMALFLWKQVNGPELPGISRTKILSWAAQMHEIGLSISHGSYHQHGHYLLHFSDLAGFTRYEQLILAKLVLFHRKKIDSKTLHALDEDAQNALKPMLLCLRIAAVLARRREDIRVRPKLNTKDGVYVMTVDTPWLKLNPLTHAGIKNEMSYFKRIDVDLKIQAI